MASNFSSGSPVITWGGWRRLPNGQWGREGQDSLGNWYQDNRGEDPRDPRSPGQAPPMEEFTQDFGSMAMTLGYSGQNLNYGGYDEAPTGQQTQSAFASSSYTRSSEPESRRHKGKGKHIGEHDQSESSHRVEDKGRSSRLKGDGKGHGKSTRAPRTEVKGNGRKMEQQTTSGPKQDQGAGAKDSSQLSIGHVFGRQPVDIDKEPGQPSTDDKPHDIGSNKENSPEELTSRIDALVISDNLRVDTSSKLKAAEVDAIGNEALFHSPQSPVSSNCPTEASSGIAAGEPHHAISRAQTFMQQLIDDVESILQTRSQTRNAVTREHAPASSNQTRRNTASSRTENEVTQPDSSPRRSTPQKKRKMSNRQSDGENSDDGEHTQYPTSKGKEKEEKLFACPYVKHRSLRCGPKSCSNKGGWPNVRRVKEHLYRRHLRGPYCPRCQAPFVDTEALGAHLRQEEPCELKEGTSPEGITEAQEKELKSRAGMRKTPEEERWQKMYTILFPDDEDHIPSPYYDPDDSCGCPKNATLAGFEAYARLELPKQLANGFQEELDASGGEFDKSELAKYTARFLNKMFNDYRWNAHDIQRAGTLPEAAIEDAHSQSIQQAESSLPAYATGMAFPPFEDGSQAMHGPTCPSAPDFQQIGEISDGTMRDSHKQPWGLAGPSRSNLSSDMVMADPGSKVYNPSLSSYPGGGTWGGTLLNSTSGPVHSMGTYASVQDASGMDGNAQQNMNVRKPKSDSGYASWLDGNASIFQLNQYMDATTDNSLPQPSNQEAAILEYISNMDVNSFGYNDHVPMIDSVQGSEFSTAPCLDQNGARVNRLEAGANPQQATGLEQQATVSGCGGSGTFQNYQPWIYQSGQ